VVLTLFERLELGPLPDLFRATTLKEYTVPFRRPEMVHPVNAVTHLLPWGCEVAT
jgi:hypothetical protein